MRILSPIVEGEGLKVVYLYAPGDKELCTPLKAHLSILRRNNLIREWDAGLLRGGQKRLKEIDRNICEADLILLVVSPAFLDSDETYTEHLGAAMKRHDLGEARVVPILMASCDCEDASFHELEALPRDGRFVDEVPKEGQNVILKEIAVELRNLVETMLDERGIGVSSESISSQSKAKPVKVLVELEKTSENDSKLDDEELKLMKRFIARFTGIGEKEIGDGKA